MVNLLLKDFLHKFMLTLIPLYWHNSPLKFLRTTSVAYLSTPEESVHFLVSSCPSINNLEPFLTYCSIKFMRFSLKTTTLCHCVLSFCSLLSLSFHLSLVAIDKLHTLPPLWKDLISGSCPTFPIKITLFTLLLIKSIMVQ